MTHYARTARQRARVRVTGDADRLVLTGPDGRPHALNATARAVWELCDGRTTVGEMVDAICELSSADPDVIAAEVDRLLDELVRNGLVDDTVRAAVTSGDD